VDSETLSLDSKIYCCYTLVIYQYCPAKVREKRGAHRIFVERPEGRRPVGRTMRRWEDNIKMDLQEVGWGAWTGLGWFRIWRGGGLL
jgi:hypothetical protein